MNAVASRRIEQCAKSCRLCCVFSSWATVPCLTARHGPPPAVPDWLLSADMRRRCRSTAPKPLIPNRPPPPLNRKPPPRQLPPPSPSLLHPQRLRLRHRCRRPRPIDPRDPLLRPLRPLLLRSTCRYERHASPVNHVKQPRSTRGPHQFILSPVKAATLTQRCMSAATNWRSRPPALPGPCPHGRYALPDRRIGEGGVDRSVEQSNDVGRRVPWRTQSAPAADRVATQKIRQRRQVRNERHACRRRDRKRADRTCLHERD